MNHVIVLSGPPGAGKSAVAEALCERYDRMLHVEVDDLRHWVKAGYRHPWVGDEQAVEQLVLAARNAAAVARQSVAMRYAVAITDVVLADHLPWYREAFAGIGGEVHFALLLPSLAVTIARADSDDQARVGPLHARFHAEAAAGRFPGALIDSSADADARATADRVQDAVASGASLWLGASA